MQIYCHDCHCLPRGADNHPDVRLSDPADIDVYLIGASGLHSQLAEPLCSSSYGLKELDPGLDFEVGEKELRTAALITNEESARVWQVIQRERMKRTSAAVETHRGFAIVPDSTHLWYNRRHM